MLASSSCARAQRVIRMSSFDCVCTAVLGAPDAGCAVGTWCTAGRDVAAWAEAAPTLGAAAAALGVSAASALVEDDEGIGGAVAVVAADGAAGVCPTEVMGPVAETV
jgi:hypothetical protein